MSVVVTRMQELAYEFSKKFPGVIPLTPTAGRDDSLPHPSQPACGRAQGTSAHLLGPKPWSPQLFSRGCVRL